MIWDRIKSDWNHYKGNAKQQWSKLSDELLDAIQGDREHLASRVQQAYGVGKEQAEKEVAGWQALQTDREPSLLRKVRRPDAPEATIPRPTLHVPEARRGAIRRPLPRRSGFRRSA